MSRCFLRNFLITLVVTMGIGRLEAQKVLTKPYVTYQGNLCGMFIIFDNVLILIDAYEHGLVAGCEVDLGDEGHYYDPSVGKNWWNYFCQPIKLGTAFRRKIAVTQVEQFRDARSVENEFSRQKCYALIQKYIHIRPVVEQKIQTFVDHQFGNDYVIGIHYRGTDKYTEAPRVAFEAVGEAVEKSINTLPASINYRIFIATDEWAFVDYMESHFPGRLCYYQGSPRSTDSQPVHMNAKFSGYDKGESALIDCILLSRCDLLIRCSSNLSRWSTYFNPEIPVIELNQRH